MIPQILVTLAPVPISAPDIDIDVVAPFQDCSYIYNSTSLRVPPPTVDCPSRRTIVQRGLRLGSHRLNCAESTIAIHADLASTRRTFDWARSPLTLNPIQSPSSKRRGHSRSRSLNSLADLKLAGVNMNINTTARHHCRTEPENHSPVRNAIDLSILASGAFATPTYDFACAL